MNQRDRMLDLVYGGVAVDYIPAAFFMHFDEAHKQGQAAIDKHLEFFRFTGMDFVKIQYEQIQPQGKPIRKAADWKHLPLYGEEFFEPTLQVVEGLVNAAKDEAVVVMTLYSPFMWAVQYDRQADFAAAFEQEPAAAAKGLEIMTENVLTLARRCKQAGVDGFYACTQGGEAFRFKDKSLFTQYIRPSDLTIWKEIEDCTFNILHVCDYEGPYDDFSPFYHYPGHVVNICLKRGGVGISSRKVVDLFQRPFMGGLERKGVLASGSLQAIRQAVNAALMQAPGRFILAADCTVPSDTPWENLKTAIEAAHAWRG